MNWISIKDEQPLSIGDYVILTKNNDICCAKTNWDNARGVFWIIAQKQYPIDYATHFIEEAKFPLPISNDAVL